MKMMVKAKRPKKKATFHVAGHAKTALCCGALNANDNGMDGAKQANDHESDRGT